MSRSYDMRMTAAAPANKPSDSKCLCDGQPISYAMAYVKSQSFGELYSPTEALYRGTLFRALDLPYCSGGKR